MSANRFGERFSWVSFGESHGPALGVIIDGCPAGLTLDVGRLQWWMDRRRPGQSSVTTQRQELDRVEVLSGVYEGKTLGTPITMIVRNEDARSNEYSKEKLAMRKGHATDLWQEKFGYSDPRGSGRASGRETVARVMAGFVAESLCLAWAPQMRMLGLSSKIGEFVLDDSVKENWIAKLRMASTLASADKISRNELGSVAWADAFSARFPDEERHEQVQKYLVGGRERGESYGGAAEVFIEGAPRGLGQPVFHKLKADFAQAMMSIGATCGFEMADGFSASSDMGSVFHHDDQEYAGVRGGISTGETMNFRVHFKPTSSLGAMALQGRHDPCIVPRALVVAEAMAWCVLADHMLWQRTDKVFTDT